MDSSKREVTWNEVRVNVGWGTLRGKTCVVGGRNLGEYGLRIVGLHGWLDNCNTFDTLVPLLPPKTKVLVLDFPGHGWSDHIPLGAHYNPVMFACNIQTAVRKLGWKKFVLMGHSMGAAISAFFTALFPEHVQALILFDFLAPMHRGNFIERCQTHALDLLKAEKLSHLPPLVYSEKEAIDRLISARVFGHTDDPAIEEEAAQILLPRSAQEVEDGYIWSHDRKARATFLVLLSGKNWLETVAAIKCPVLLFCATRGVAFLAKEFFSEVIDVYKENASWFHYETVEGCHHVHLTDPERVVPMVEHFLKVVVKKDDSLQAKL